LGRLWYLFLTILWTLSAPALAGGDDGSWESVEHKNGIHVQRKTMPDSPLFAFRGEGVVQVPIALLVTVLLDDDIAVEWVDLMTEHSVVRPVTEHEKIIYESYGLPWPISDRDYVLRQVASYDDANHVFILDFESVDDPAKPALNDVVRAMAYRTYWRLEMVDATSTNVEVEVFTDPKGLLPAWLINLIQKDWPWKTIEGLVKRANKGDLVPNPYAAEW